MVAFVSVWFFSPQLWPPRVLPRFISRFHPSHFQRVGRHWGCQTAGSAPKVCVGFYKLRRGRARWCCSVTPLLRRCLQTRRRELRLVPLSFLERKRSHQNLQEEVPSQAVTEESAKNVQVKVTTVISDTLCRGFRFLIAW